jgi:hypothetical protein
MFVRAKSFPGEKREIKEAASAKGCGAVAFFI